MNKKELLNSDHFCILPFVHACVWTNGKVQPCCINPFYELGSVKEKSLEDIFSSSNPKLQSMRKQMIEGPDLPESCHRCSRPEKTYNALSYRNHSNKTYGHLLDNIEFDNDNNVVTERISLWDVRFSNLCNLKCRTCDSINSSKIAEEEISKEGRTVPIFRKAYDDANDFYDFFIKHIDTIEEIYFCGGEPLLLAEHYKILDLLIEHKKFNVLLRYNSNCTQLTFKDKNVVRDYWPLFSNIRLDASLEAGWEQLNYVRHGADWDTIVDNLRSIKNNCPHVVIQIGPVVGILNVFHIRRMHEFLIKEQIIYPDNIYYNICNYPVYYSITALPSNLKDKVKEHLTEYVQSVTALGAGSVVEDEVNKIITYMYSKDDSKYLDNFKDETARKDSFRNENFLEVFPEYKELYE